MGYYINSIEIEVDEKGDTRTAYLPAKDKADFLLNYAGARQLPRCPDQWCENLVCVVENGTFDAAGYAFDEREMRSFNYGDDGRRRSWLIVPNAAKLAGYKKDEEFD